MDSKDKQFSSRLSRWIIEVQIAILIGIFFVVGIVHALGIGLTGEKLKNPQIDVAVTGFSLGCLLSLCLVFLRKKMIEEEAHPPKS